MSGPVLEEVMEKLLRLRAVVSTAADVLRNNSQMFGLNANVRVITPVREALEQSLKDSDPRTP